MYGLCLPGGVSTEGATRSLARSLARSLTSIGDRASGQRTDKRAYVDQAAEESEVSALE
jgi:hypothetical protein